MERTPSTHDISARGRSSVRDRLTALGFEVQAASGRAGHHLTVARPGGPTRSVWVGTNLKPKPAGGTGPLSLDWQIRRKVRADVIALADLSTGRVWLMSLAEVPRTAQQHNQTYHHMIMVTQKGWTSAPHERIRDDQFDHLLVERRADSLI